MINRQYFLFSVVLLAVVSLSSARSTPQCSAFMSKAGLTDRFAFAVAHGVHSLTVQDLQMFNPLVNETNRVPVVNLDLTSDEPILRSAPLAPQIIPGGKFENNAMQTVDRVLSNMDRQHYDVSGYTALERLVHALHMNNCWAMTLKQYQKLVENNAQKDVCPCVMDIDKNGVMKALRFIAMNLREPFLIHGNVLGGYQWEQPADGSLDIKLEDPDTNPDAIPCKVQSTADWGKWKKAFLNLKSTDDYEFAYFLYCALN